MEKPLVSIICICHNHGPYIHEAMQSAIEQSYPNIELIVIDDHSEDNG